MAVTQNLLQPPKLGIPRLETILTDYTGGIEMSRKRPDRAKAMPKTI